METGMKKDVVFYYREKRERKREKVFLRFFRNMERGKAFKGISRDNPCKPGKRRLKIIVRY